MEITTWKDIGDNYPIGTFFIWQRHDLDVIELWKILENNDGIKINNGSMYPYRSGVNIFNNTFTIVGWTFRIVNLKLLLDKHFANWIRNKYSLSDENKGFIKEAFLFALK